MGICISVTFGLNVCSDMQVSCICPKCLSVVGLGKGVCKLSFCFGHVCLLLDLDLWVALVFALYRGFCFSSKTCSICPNLGLL